MPTRGHGCAQFNWRQLAAEEVRLTILLGQKSAPRNDCTPQQLLAFVSNMCCSHPLQLYPPPGMRVNDCDA